AILKERLARAMSTFTSKAKADVLAELGVEDIATAKKTLAEAEAARTAQMTELEKAKAEIAEVQAKAAQATAEAEAIKVEAAEALLQAAVISKAGSFQDPMDAWSFIDRAKIEVQDDGTYKGIDEALKTLIEAKPYLVKADSNTTGPGTPARTKPKSIVEKLLEKNQQQQGGEQPRRSTVKM
ncbi:hypothetical protein LCGC14_1566710, partial [marine sediment metagenome]